MKIPYKFLSVLFVALLSITLPAFKAGGGDKGEKISFYHTYEDYTKGKITGTWDHFDNNTGSNYSAASDGKYVKNGALRDRDDWGYVDSKGDTWRIFKKMGVKKVIVTGNIWLYTDFKGEFTKDAAGKPKALKVPSGGSGNYFSLWVLISHGGNSADLDECTEKMLKKYFADDADLVAEVKDKGIHDGQSKKWLDDLNNVIDWVTRYNAKHK